MMLELVNVPCLVLFKLRDEISMYPGEQSTRMDKMSWSIKSRKATRLPVR